MSRTLNAQLIRNTTATVTTDNKVSYSYPKTRSGLENTYSVLGINVSIETTKERGWDLYQTAIRISYSGHWGTPDGFSEWITEYKTSLGITARFSFVTHSENVENHSANKIAKAHEVGVLASESFVLTIITKYIELLFNAVNKEQIVRQIEELTSQLNKVSA
jgi:hypothetical protein